MNNHNSPSQLVEIRNVSKQFDTTLALDAITASIPKNQIVGIVGPDGAGKTTLIRLMAGLMIPTAGAISVCGFDTVKQQDVLSTLISYMPQKFGLYEDLTVQQNLDLYAGLKSMSEDEKEKSLKKLLAFTSLEPFTSRLAGALSGGMKQKLGLACALLQKPTLLLLDEPSVGVDPLSRRELWKMVHDLLEDGITVVWSTAYLDEAEKCHSLLLLDQGKLLFNGPPSALSDRVKGRTFKITDIKGSKRQLLEKTLNTKGVLDGIIQGNDIRALITSSDPYILEHLDNEQNLKIIATPPRLEDAFVDILGGGPGGTSQLAAHITFVKSKSASEIVINADKLTKKFGSFTAANEISFEIKRGEIFGLLGPNGAGKSTTFKMLCGLLAPTSGTATVMDLDLQKAPSKARQRIGYMAQKFSLYSDLTVLQNLRFFSGIYGLGRQAQKDAIAEMIKIFGLTPYLSTAAGVLPLGFKQRLALSCSIMHRPEILFLDEPTSGVDPLTRREFWTHINGLVEKGITIMITTHFMDEAEYCDRIALVYAGQVIHEGPPDLLKSIAKSPSNKEPTLEDAFIALIEQYNLEQV